MPPTANATAPRRQSCDRCHGQKLRCTRPGNSDTGVCNRCFRQGAQCVYSSSLPKGRPSMYSNPPAMAATPITPPTPLTPVTPVTPELRRRNLAGSHTANANAVTNANEDAILAGTMDTSTWPYWNDVQVDGSEQDLSQSALNLHTSAAFLDVFPNILGWASTSNSDGNGDSNGSGSAQGGTPPPSQLHEQSNGLGNDIFESISRNNNINIDKSGPDVGIAQLSQLSTRLYPLHRSSCAMAESASLSFQSRDSTQAHQSLLIDDAAFKSVATWLVQISTNLPMNISFRNDHQNPALETPAIGDTLHDAFSASHHLLEILRCLQGDVVADIFPLALTSGSGGSNQGVDFWTSITPQSAQSTRASSENIMGFEQSKRSSSYARPSSQYSNTVVRHLVIACHTLLLNIYVAVLSTLQHDADLRNSYYPIDAYTNAASLADIRLVLVVQVCSYLIERQHRAVDLYLSPQSASPPSQPHDLSGSHQPSPPATIPIDREAISDQEMEVQQRLARLRQTLRI